jgi:hypothetical protein
MATKNKDKEQKKKTKKKDKGYTEEEKIEDFIRAIEGVSYDDDDVPIPLVRASDTPHRRRPTEAELEEDRLKRLERQRLREDEYAWNEPRPWPYGPTKPLPQGWGAGHPTPAKQEKAARKGGTIRKPREFARGGIYRGKPHSYAAGGRVIDTSKPTRRKK